MNKIKRRCKCGCGSIVKPGNKWIYNHHVFGYGNPKYKHGLSQHRLYKVWNAMNSRCYNINDPGYDSYGGRGIRVCIRWRRNVVSFYNWAINNGWGKGLQIDRVDNNGNYHPNNCRFVTAIINSCNIRMPKNNTSGYVGVSIYKGINRSRYISYITIKGSRKHLGCYDKPKQAAITRDNYIIKNNLPNKLSFYENNLRNRLDGEIRTTERSCKTG